MHIQRYFAVVITSLFLFFVLITGCGTRGIDKQTFEQIQAANDSILSGSGSYTFRYELISNTGTLSSGQQADVWGDGVFTFKGKQYTNIKNEKNTLRTTSVSNGSVQKSLREQTRENGETAMQGHINEINPDLTKHDNPLFYVMDYPYMMINRDTRGRCSITKKSQGVYDGNHCRIIEYEYNNMVVKFWVSENLSYRVLRIARIWRGDLSGETRIWYRDIDGIPFPERISDTVYRSSDTGNEAVSTTITTFGDDWRLNIDVPDSVFDIQFPDGVKVIDSRK